MRTVRVTAPEASGLTCPFTGKKLEVFMTVQPGSITFSSPNAFTLKEPVGSIEELVDRASMRNGVAGAVDGSKPVDPYTGEKLLLREISGRYCYFGGFNPRAARSTLGEFLYYATMRDGVAKMAKPSEPKPIERFSKPRELKHKICEPDDFTREVAEKAVAKSGMFVKPTTVHVSRKGGK